MATQRPEFHLVRVARIGKPHGIRGDVTVQIFTDSPEIRFVPGAVFTVVKAKSQTVAGDLHESLTVKNARWNKNILLLSFAEITDRNQAELHRNVELYAEPEESTEDDEIWYAEELRGFTVRLNDVAGETIGTVSDLITGEFQDLLELERDSGETTLVPFVEEIVPEIDEEARVVVLTPPQGLLDLNAEASNQTGEEN